MKWSVKIGEYRGIPVKIHATFVLIILWVALSYWIEGQGLSATIAGIIFVLALFVCVVLHEFGHALMAQRYDIKTRDITLLPIGGVARLERMPDDPKQELWVAIAGPLVNVVIGVLLFFWLQLSSSMEPISKLTMTSGSFLERLMVVNIFLVLFNLLPAFPMDGGRVLRAFLAMRMDYSRATHYAANVGQAMALLFGFLGFFTNPFLIFIALFVWIGAAQEASMVNVRTAFDGIPVSSAMLTDFQVLYPSDSLSRAIQLILAGSQQDFPVVENGNVVGILTRDKLMRALAEHGQNYPVSDVMSKKFEKVESSEMLQSAMNRLQNCDCRTMPVIKKGELIGLINMENIGEFMMIQSALKKAARPA
jgi:Zn-dependent protease/predicted transcriptional regulator